MITERDIESLASPESFARGVGYFESGCVSELRVRGSQVSALCQGSQSRPYRVSATVTSRGVEAVRCSCPYDWGGLCKHQVALLLAYARGAFADDAEGPVPELASSSESAPEADLSGLSALTREQLEALVGLMVRREPRFVRLLPPPPNAPPMPEPDFSGPLEAYTPAVMAAFAYLDQTGSIRELRDLAEDLFALGSTEPAQALAGITALVEALERYTPPEPDDLDFDDLGYYEAEPDEDPEPEVEDLEDEVSARMWQWLPELRLPTHLRQAWILRCLGPPDPTDEFPSTRWLDFAGCVAETDDTPFVESALRKRVNTYRSLAAKRPDRGQLDAWIGVLAELYIGGGRESDLEGLAWEYERPMVWVYYLLGEGRADEALEYARANGAKPLEVAEATDVLAHDGKWPAARQMALLALEGLPEDSTEWPMVARIATLQETVSEALEQEGDRRAARAYSLRAFLTQPSQERLTRVSTLSKQLGDEAEAAQKLLDGLSARKDLGQLRELVPDLHLMRGDRRAALEAVQSQRMPYSVIERVADGVVDAYPVEVIALYQRMGEGYISGGNKSSYELAAKVLSKAKQAAEAAGHTPAFQSYLNDLRTKYARRHSLLKQLKDL
ncbi:MAG TPA: SWIM zinc finger family protein [Armatimonadota bacterium]